MKCVDGSEIKKVRYYGNNTKHQYASNAENPAFLRKSDWQKRALTQMRALAQLHARIHFERYFFQSNVTNLCSLVYVVATVVSN